MKTTKYHIKTDKTESNIKLAVVSDLHARPYKKILSALKQISPDIILLPGDILEISAGYMEGRNKNALDFLCAASGIAPCYYTYGNHEIYNSHAKRGMSKKADKLIEAKNTALISSWGINIINDSFLRLKSGICIGGLACGHDMDPQSNFKEPDLSFLDLFAKEEGFKILLCHYPHYYERYIKDKSIDLIISGHAHGGQWRICGRGVYAPHQGLFPKYTSGIHDGRHIISRGAVNNAPPIPRLFNPCEILEITVSSIIDTK